MDAVTRRTMRRCVVERLERRRLLTVAFFDDFPNATIDPAKWPLNQGAAADTAGIAEPSGAYSLRFDRHPSGRDQIESRAINLAGVTSATVSYHYERTGGGDSPGPGADLVLEYRNSQGNWIEAHRHLGGLPDMTTFSRADFVVPPDGLHGQFQFRFHNAGEGVLFDDWFVDNVGVTTGPAEIRGQLFIDGNRDGVRDPEEQPLVGWTVYLDANGNGRLDGNEPSAVSAADGAYAFIGLDPGRHDVSVVPQTAWIPSAPASWNGGLVWAASYVDGAVNAESLSGAWAMAQSSDGRTLYVAASGDDSLTVFRRDPVSGELAPLQTFIDGTEGVDGIDGARAVLLSPDGAMVFVAGSNDDAVAGFHRDAATGLLTYGGVVRDGLENVDGLDGAWSVTISPDGLDLYATGTNDDAVAVFHRESLQAPFLFVERQRDGDELPPEDPPQDPPAEPVLLDGLDGARGVAISPDGEHVYVAGANDHAVVAFARNPLTGALTHVQTLKDGEEGTSQLAGPFTLSVSTDGRFVYVASVIDNALTVFSRNVETGELEEIQELVDNVAGVNGLDFVSSLAFSADGSRLYAAASDDNAVGVFQRDVETGLLNFAQIILNGQDSVAGLLGVRGLVVSVDGRHLYTASSFDHAVSVFRAQPVHGQFVASGEVATNLDFGQFVAAPVWDGGGANTLWSTGANWASQTPPQPGDRLTFRGGERTTNDNDLAAGTAFGSVTFVNGDFTLNGNRIVVRPFDMLAWLNSSGNNTVVLPWTLGGAVTSRVDQGSLTFSGQVDTVGYEWTIDALDGTTSIVSGRIVGAGGLRKTGTGTLVLDGADAALNMYSGATALEAGVIELRGAGRFGDVAIGTTVRENAILRLLTAVPLLEPLTLFAPVQGANGAQLNSVVNFGAGARFEVLDDNATMTVGGALLNLNNAELRFLAATETSLLLLKFTSDYAGPTRLEGDGIIRLGQANVLPDNGTVSVSATTTFDLNGFAETIGTLTGEGRIVLGGGRLTVNGGQGLTYSGIISGEGGVTKAGVGTFKLTGAQAYLGATIIESGEMQVLGSLVPSSPVTVRGSGVLGGNGTMGAVEVQSGGCISPGPGLETLRTRSLSLTTGALVELDVVGAATDRIEVTGSVHLSGATLALVAATAPSFDNLVLIQNDGVDAVVGAFAGLAEGAEIIVAGARCFITYHGGDGNDVALVTTAAVTGLLFNDLNTNHARDEGEPGLPGWTVFADANGNGHLDTGEIMATTDATGRFTITGLTPGVHRIAEVVRPGWQQTTPDVSTTSLLRFVEFQRDGVNNVDGLDGAWGLAVSPDGVSVYATSVIDDSVAVFRRNDATGKLTFVGAMRDGTAGVDGLDGAVAVAVSPDGKHVYAAGVGDNSIALFERSNFDGALTYVDRYLDGAPGIDGIAAPLGVAISPDGRHVFVVGNGDSAIAVFSRDATSGRLTMAARIKDGDQNNGLTADALFGAWSVAVSPDGKHIYVTANVDDAVSVFARNSDTGTLTYLQALRDGENNVDGLDGASGVAVSADGGNVYVTGDRDDAVVVLRRDPATGMLTYVRRLGTAEGVPRMDGANGVALNPEGTDLFVASAFGDAIVVFTRDRATGELTFVEAPGEGSAGVDGLDAAHGIVVTLDGRHVYGAGQNDDAVAVFARDVPYFLVTVAAGGQASNLVFGNFQVDPHSTPGDTNGDGVVNLDDLNNVRNSFGTNSSVGDTDGDGDVDLEDFNAVRNNFGTGGAPSGTATLTSATAASDAVFHAHGLAMDGAIGPRRRPRAPLAGTLGTRTFSHPDAWRLSGGA